MTKFKVFDVQYAPRGAAFLSDGSIAVCDNGNPGSAHILRQGGQHIGRISPGHGQIWDIARHADCLYITECNTDNGSIFMYDTQGNHKRTVAVGYKGDAGIAVTDRAIFVTSSDENCVYKLDMPTGSNKQIFIQKKIGLLCPSFTASDDRHVCISSFGNHKVFLFDMSGVVRHVYGGYGTGPGQLNCPTGVVIDAQGRMLICDQDNHRVCIVSTEGKHLKKDGLEFPDSLAMSPSGDAVVTSRECKRLVIYNTARE